MKKNIFLSSILVLLFTVIFSSNAYAVCSHPSLGPTYSEAAHPHAYYRTCSSCGVKVYTGGYATKNHGDGTWGSGTCPSCGTHTYTGRSCTSSGRCVCGATQPALGHSNSTRIDYEVSHPHRRYTWCTRCSEKLYTGGYATLDHGRATSTSCPNCGNHSYSPDFSQSSIHPHPLLDTCSCGDSIVREYSYTKNCATCRALARSADVYEEVPLVLSKLDSGTGGSVPTFIGIRVAYSYTEDYIKSGNDFYSLGVASETRILSVDPVFAHLVEARANSRIPYYDSGDREIFTGRLLPVNYPLSMDYSSVVGDPFHNSPIPAYARGGITALLSGGLGPALHNTTIMY